LDLFDRRDARVGMALDRARRLGLDRRRRWRWGGAVRRLAGSLPANAAPVDLGERLLDPVLATEVVDRLAALIDLQVVVDDQVAAGTQPRIEHLERELGGVVGVAVEARDRPAA